MNDTPAKCPDRDCADAVDARIAELEMALDAADRAMTKACSHLAEMSKHKGWDGQELAAYQTLQKALPKVREVAPGHSAAGVRCANCGADGAAIAGGQLADGEAVCSSRCMDQILALGCPQERHGGYRHPGETEELLRLRQENKMQAVSVGSRKTTTAAGHR